MGKMKVQLEKHEKNRKKERTKEQWENESEIIKKAVIT